MPVIDTFSLSLVFTATLSNTSGSLGGTLTFDGLLRPEENDYGGQPITYTDATGNGMTADDSMGPLNIPYAGFQLTTSMGNFAVFVQSGNGPFAPDIYHVPHNGELSVYPAGYNAGTILGESYFFLSGNQPVNYCLLAGTHIATPEGERLVETRQVGDLVCGLDGCMMAVTWNGRQSVSTRFGPAERLCPVCIEAGALGDGLPTRDLFVTADHAVLLDGMLINAGALVNETSIRFMPLSTYGDSYSVFSIELERHEILLAEGAPVESFFDYAGRRGLDNYQAYLEAYGSEQAIPDMDIPRISAARLVPTAIQQRLAGAAAA